MSTAGIGTRPGLEAPLPILDPRPLLTMDDMGHGGHAGHGKGMEGGCGAAMGMKGMEGGCGAGEEEFEIKLVPANGELWLHSPNAAPTQIESPFAKELIERERVTFVAAAVSVGIDMIAELKRRPRDLSSVRGIILGGASAGSLCWFEEGTTDSRPKELSIVKCLGLLQGSHSPHYDAEPGRRPLYQKLIGSGQMKPGYACDNDAGIYFEDTEPRRVVATRADAKVYYVRRSGDRAVEQVIEPERLT